MYYARRPLSLLTSVTKTNNVYIDIDKTTMMLTQKIFRYDYYRDSTI